MAHDHRKRLSAEERRAQLIAIGARHVEGSSFDDLSTDAVAQEAGISRGLLFHYFPTRDDFIEAIAADAADELLTRTRPDPDAPVLDQWRSGLARYIEFVEASPDAYVNLIRGAVGRSEGIQHIVDRTRNVHADRILNGIGSSFHEAPPAMRYLARGYVACIEEVVVEWVRDDRPDRLDRQAVLELCEGAAVALAAVAGVPSDELA